VKPLFTRHYTRPIRGRRGARAEIRSICLLFRRRRLTPDLRASAHRGPHRRASASCFAVVLIPNGRAVGGRSVWSKSRTF